jgi:hypothetical protein
LSLVFGCVDVQTTKKRGCQAFTHQAAPIAHDDKELLQEQWLLHQGRPV